MDTPLHVDADLCTCTSITHEQHVYCSTQLTSYSQSILLSYLQVLTISNILLYSATKHLVFVPKLISSCQCR